ncbi:glycosyltransferase [Hyphomicrobium methylovorum]|uniref:glycosyltransferase n=1 Tax=Hyphomicrobium methylovorum TaxID=84 RepID=UPI0015E71913|nr:glycosyltransferase family 2 protein [Hyphomicrobium methylovorum]
MSSIDVAIPCFQYGRYLRQCVSSVLEQDVDGLRVHIIDNASTDDSLAVAKELAHEDKRVSYISHAQNIGPNGNYNAAVDWASGDYFLLLDADDLLAPGCLKRATDILDSRSDIAFTCGVEAMLTPAGNVEIPYWQRFELDPGWHSLDGGKFIAGLCQHPINWIGAPTVVRRTSVQKKVGHYRASLPYTDDLEMWLRMALHGGVAITTEVQAIRRQHEARHGSAYEQSFLRDFVEREAAFASFFANEGAACPDAQGLLDLVRKRLGEHAYWIAWSKIIRVRPREAMDLISYSLKRRPVGAVIPPVSWPFRKQKAITRSRVLSCSW